MSGFVIDTCSPRGDWNALMRPTAAFERKGMRPSLDIEKERYRLRLFANPSHDPAEALSRDAEGRYCTYVGTLVYEGQTGQQATSAILQDFRGLGAKCLRTAIGNYCLLIDDGERLVVTGDPAGLHHYYANDGLRFVSNSFVAMAVAQLRHEFRTQELLEYILLGATFGRNTLIGGINLVDSNSHIRVSHDVTECISHDDGWQAAVANAPRGSLESQIEHALGTADSYYGQIAKAFGLRTTAALSGGYDSRLNLALMRKHGIDPSLFVYGAPADADVVIAKEICRGEGLKLSHQDRSARPSLDPEAYWHNQESVFHGLDGLTQYGFACEPFEISHRQERVAGKLVAVNGGGGEIWRDFWKLPDRSMSARDFAFAYFSGRFSGLQESLLSNASFLGRLADKIDDIVNSHGRDLSSPEVQSLYPRVRLRFWQGKNNSVDNHIGFGITPFSEAPFSQSAVAVPMSAKRDGWFERQLLLRVSPALAAYRSSHGYDLASGPNLSEKFKSFVTRCVPVALRAEKRRRSLRRDRFYFQREPYVSARFGSGTFEVSRYVSMSQLGDGLAFSRALTVERMLRGDWGAGL